VRLLGIDYGKKRIGVALGEGGMVSPLLVLLNDGRVIEKISSLCKQEKIDKIVIGMVSSLRGEIGEFARKLKEMIGLLVIFQDETLTTQKGIGRMIESRTSQKARRERIDAIAAAEILESYFSKGGENV